MKTTRLILAISALVALASCQKTAGTGSVSFALREGEVAEETKGSVSDYVPSLPASSAFRLVVTNKTSGATVYDGTLGDWDPETGFAAGSYNVVASYGSESEEGPGKPYFYGTQDFTIIGGQTTEVQVTVSLGNCIVKVTCTDAFKNYYPQQNFVISTPDNQTGFAYDGTAVFVAWKFTVSGTVTNQYGKSSSLAPKTWTVEPATCYTVKYDVTNVGGVTVTITFDNTVETVELGEIDLNS